MPLPFLSSNEQFNPKTGIFSFRHREIIFKTQKLTSPFTLCHKTICFPQITMRTTDAVQNSLLSWPSRSSTTPPFFQTIHGSQIPTLLFCCCLILLPRLPFANINTTLYLTCIVLNRIIPRRANQRRTERETSHKA